MKVLLIFVFFNNSGSSLSNATSFAEMTSITKVSRAGKPSSLRFRSTARGTEVRIDKAERRRNEPTCCRTAQGFFADDQPLDVPIHRCRSVNVAKRDNVILHTRLEQVEERPYAAGSTCE